MTAPPPADLPILGAVLYDGGFAIEELLATVRHRLAALRLGGVLPRDGERLAIGRHAMLLEDIGSGATVTISQDLGAGADSCILDVDGLTRARLAITAAIEADVDLVFVGKFAKQEIAGHGVREEIGAAMLAGVPALVVLRAERLDDWRAFAGDDFHPLPADVAAIVAWAEAVHAARR